MKLTTIDFAPYVNLNSLIHIVNTGDNNIGANFTAPLSFHFGIYESAEVTYVGSNKWLLSNFQTEDYSGITARIF